MLQKRTIQAGFEVLKADFIEGVWSQLRTQFQGRRKAKTKELWTQTELPWVPTGRDAWMWWDSKGYSGFPMTESPEIRAFSPYFVYWEVENKSMDLRWYNWTINKAIPLGRAVRKSISCRSKYANVPLRQHALQSSAGIPSSPPFPPLFCIEFQSFHVFPQNLEEICQRSHPNPYSRQVCQRGEGMDTRWVLYPQITVRFYHSIGGNRRRAFQRRENKKKAKKSKPNSSK